MRLLFSLLGAFLFTSVLLAQPDFSSSIGLGTIGPGNITTLTYTIDNTGSAIPVIDMAFTTNLPAGVTVANPAGISHNCFTATITAAGGTISLVDGSLSGASSCSITVNITSSTPGTHTITSGDLTSSAGNSGTASSNLTVNATYPSFTKSFSPSTIDFGELSTLTFILDNTAGAVDLNSFQFIDNLPTGMEVASPNNFTTTCTNLVVTAVPGSNVITVAPTIFGQPTVAAGASCAITVNVVGNQVGSLENLTNNATILNNFFQTLNIGSAGNTLEVSPPDLLTIQKSFDNNPILPGGTTDLTFTISNLDRNNDATNITFTDDLDAMLSGAVATGTPISDVCGSGSMLSGTSILSLTNGTIPASGSCTFTVTVSTPLASAVGAYPNTSSDVMGEINGTMITGNNADDVLYIQESPVFTKTFLDDPIPAGSSSTLEFTITNSSSTDALSDLTFTDPIGSFMSGAVVTSLPAAGSCGAGSVFINTTSGGIPIFQMIGGNLPASGSCTFTIEISTPVGVSAGPYTNTTSNLTGNLGGSSITGSTASDDLNILGVPSLSKSFLNDPVDPGSIVDLEFTLTYSENATVDATSIAFTDDLNAVIPGLAAIGLPLNDICGTGSSISGTTNLSFTNGTMSPGDECTFTVQVQVPAGIVTGAYTNTTSALTAMVSGQSATGNAAVDDLDIGGLEFTKEFLDDVVLPGETTTLRFTLNNTSDFDATGIIFTDNLSTALSGMTALAPLPTNPCGAGSSISGTTFLIFVSGSVPNNSSCSFDVQVLVPVSATPGTYTNTTSNLIATIDGASRTLSVASDQITVENNFIAMSKSFTDDPVVPGDPVSVTFDIENLDPTNTIADLSFSTDFDSALTGLVVNSLSSNDCGGVVGGVGTGLMTLTGGTLTGGGTCSITIVLDTPASAAFGSIVPCTTSTASGTINGFAVVGDAASDNLEFSFLELTKSFSGPVAAGSTVQLTFMIENFSNNTITGLQFSDDLESMLSGAIATNLPLTDVCGTGSTLSGSSIVLFQNGELAPTSTCSFTVDILIPANAIGTTYTNTTGTLQINGLDSADPATANLVVLAPPGFSKSFAPPFINVGGVSTLTFTIDNTSSTVDANSLAFTDNFPAGLEINSTPSVVNTCGGTVTAVAGSSTVVLTGGSVSAGSTCTISVDVTSVSDDTYTNTTGDLTSTLGNSGTATAILLVECDSDATANISGTASACQNDSPDPEVTFTYSGGLAPYTFMYNINGGTTQSVTTTSGNSVTVSQSTSTPGIYNFNLISASDASSCMASISTSTATITINSLPTVSFTAPADLCINAGVQSGLGGGTPPQGSATGDMGVYSGTGVTDDGNGMTYSFDPAAAGAGVHTITYTYTDENGCIDSDSDDVEVFDLPTVSFTAPADLCIDAGVQSSLGGGTPPQGTATGDMGVYSGTGVTDDGNGMTYSFDPNAAGPGVHTITYTYTDENGCSDSDSDDVEVFDLPTVSFTAPTDLCIDAGVQSGLGGGTPPQGSATGDMGVYSGTGVTDDGNGMTYSFDPAAAGAGVHTITYTYTDENGCSDSDSDDVEVFDLPTVSFTAPADLCIDAGVQSGLGGGTPSQGTATGDMGVYSGTGVTDDGNGMTYSFDPAAAGAGVHTITYTYTDENGCSDSDSDDVEVFDLPTVGFTALVDLCIDAGVQSGLGGGTPPQGSATGDMGVYSGTGVTDDGNGMTYSFDPGAAGAGIHTITYTYTDENGCSDSDSDDVEVFDLPTVNFTAPADLCIDAGVQSGLGGGTPPQGSATGDMGVYSGTGVTDDGNGMTYSFDPAAAGAGIHTITYTYTDENGCSDSDSDDVKVFDLPIVSFTAPADLCVDAGVQSGLGGGTPPQGSATGDMGIYSGTGVTDDGNGMTYSFDPAAAGVGVHTITYTYTDENGCSDSDSDDVEVFDLPTVTFTALADLCLNAGVQSGLGSGVPNGGVYSGPGVTDGGNGMTYSFDPAAAGVGVHTITYTFTDSNSCVGSLSDDVEVFDIPVVSFTALADLCIDAGVQSGLGGGSPPQGSATGDMGIYSGTGVTDDGNGMTYSFDPAAAGAGVHTITYTYTNENGCIESASDDVEVFDLPIVSFTALADLCIDAGVQSGLGGGTPPQGSAIGDMGVYSGPGVTDDGNGMTYSFDPAAAGVGVHTITYTYTDENGCTDSDSDDVEVFDLPTVTFTALADLCLNAGVQSGLGSGIPNGGVYSGPGVTDDGNGMTYSFDPAVAGVGVHTITYTFTDTNSCVNSLSDDVEVFDIPVVSFTALADLCIDAGVQSGLGGGTPPQGSATGDMGIYSGTGVTDDGNGMTYSFDPATAGAGVHTITYTYTNENGCIESASDDVEVFDLPIVSFTALADLCIDAGVQVWIRRRYSSARFSYR